MKKAKKEGKKQKLKGKANQRDSNGEVEVTEDGSAVIRYAVLETVKQGDLR
jgi:hypothetical protein